MCNFILLVLSQLLFSFPKNKFFVINQRLFIVYNRGLLRDHVTMQISSLSVGESSFVNMSLFLNRPGTHGISVISIQLSSDLIHSYFQ